MIKKIYEGYNVVFGVRRKREEENSSIYNSNNKQNIKTKVKTLKNLI